jgi:hypothetical protein
MRIELPLANGLQEVFRTDAGCVYQSDIQNCLYVEFSGKTIRYKVKCFFRLKAIVDRIDLAKMASDPNRACDLEIITMCACENCYVLTLPQIVAFKELLAGAKVMLELNSILHDRLRRVAVKAV